MSCRVKAWQVAKHVLADRWIIFSVTILAVESSPDLYDSPGRLSKSYLSFGFSPSPLLDLLLDSIPVPPTSLTSVSLFPFPRRFQRIFCLAVVFLVGLFALAPRPATAQTPIIYHSSGDFGQETILRLDNGVSTQFAAPPTRSIDPIAVDESAGMVYWASNVTSTIERAPLNGSNVDISNIDVLLTESSSGSSRFEALHLDLQSSPQKIYWIFGSSIKRANLDGSSVETVVSGLGNIDGFSLTHVNGTARVYYADFRSVVVIDGDGTNREVLYRSSEFPNNVTIDPTSSPVEIFWSESVTNNLYRLTEGESSRTEIVSGNDVGEVFALAIDPSRSPKRLYWTVRSENEIRSSTTAGADLQTIIPDIDAFSIDFNTDLQILSGSSRPLVVSSVNFVTRSALDGSNAVIVLDPRFAPNDVSLIISPSQEQLIWANEPRRALQQQPLASSTPTVVRFTDASEFPNTVSADVSASPVQVFFGSSQRIPNAIPTYGIYRVNLDGSQRETLAPDVNRTNNFAVDATASPTRIYWTSEGRVASSNVDGTDLQQIELGIVSGIALDVSQSPRMVYFYDQLSDSIDRIRADGSDREELVPDVSTVRDLALDLSAPTPKLYWSSEFDPATSTIQRANLDGSNVEVVADDPSVEYGQIDLRTTPEIAVLSDTRTLLDDGSTYTFDATLPVGDRTSRTLRALNLGAEVLEITSASASGDFEMTSVSTNAVTENAASDLAITFQPTAAGMRTGTLTLTTNDVTEDEGTYEITLTATAEAGLRLTDGSAAGLDFTPSVTPGTDRNAVGTFRAQGTAAGGSLTGLTVTSDAPGISGITTARLFASDDDVLDSGDAELGSVAVDPQDAPATFTFSGFDATLPTTGTTFIVAFDVASDAPAESIGLRLASPDDLTVTDASLTSVNGASASTFADLPLSSVSATLPVEWGGVTARGDASGRLSVQWRTLSEVNTSGFSVQYRNVSDETTEASPSDWTDGPRLDSRGAPAEGTTYRTDVTNVAPGPYEVRVQQTDVDGTSSLSPVTTATVPLGEPLQLTATPNPVRQQATITWTVAEPGPVRVEMFDVLGRRVRTLYDGPMEANTPKRHTLRRGALASGLYFVRLTSETGTATQKVTLVR